MAKEKLFTPEDFDKPKKSKFPWKKLKKLLLPFCVIAVIAAGWGLYSYLDKEDAIKEGETQDFEEGTTVEPIDTISVDIQNPIDTTSVIPEDQIDPVGKEEPTITEIQQTDVTGNPTKIQEKTKKTSTISDNIEAEAYNVIRGDYGCVPERRQILGDKFQQIQNRVNQLKRQGVF